MLDHKTGTFANREVQSPFLACCRFREFKLEAVRLTKDRGVAVAQAARDIDLHENVLRKWVRELSTDPQHAFPGHGQMKPEQQDIDRLRKEVAKLKAERDILKKAAAYFAREVT